MKLSEARIGQEVDVFGSLPVSKTKWKSARIFGATRGKILVEFTQVDGSKVIQAVVPNRVRAK